MGTTTSTSVEILDLWHFAAASLQPVLKAEAAEWSSLLHWDFQHSAQLLSRYADNRSLPGYAALHAGSLTGYTFCVYEDSKAILGNVFAINSTAQKSNREHPSAYETEHSLLIHILELLQNSPHINRIESQLLLHPAGTHTALLQQFGFDVHRRLFLVLQLENPRPLPPLELHEDLILRPWNNQDLPNAAHLITAAYSGHPDSIINDQYRTPHGSQRFLHNIIHYAGCGSFCSSASFVITHRHTKELIALVLGSRVSQQNGHITQLCVHPSYRRLGLAHILLTRSAHQFLHVGCEEISLTVTESNTTAIDLYYAEGYECRHTFDAAVWKR